MIKFRYKRKDTSAIKNDNEKSTTKKDTKWTKGAKKEHVECIKAVVVSGDS